MKPFIMLLALFAWTNARAASVNTETEKAAMSLGAHSVSEVSFDAGASNLKESELTELRDIVNQAKASGKIKEIKVVAWADREYPIKGMTAPNQQVKLADQRATKIKNYLKKELNVSDVDVYNMAKRPNSLQELFNTQTNKIKGTLENAGAAPSSPDDMGFMGLKGKTSEALVLVYRE